MSTNPDLRIIQPQPDYKFGHELITVGDEKILYVTIPYKGCTQREKCSFCGVREDANENLVIDENLGAAVLANVKEFAGENTADSLVLYNGGNILRRTEMHQPTILEDIPKYVSAHPTINAYELEARADDITHFQESLNIIKANLGNKKLRIRLGIEFFDNELLNRHKKGITTTQIQQAVNFLNEQGIEWNGYSLLGGLEMDKKQALEAAVRTGKFIIDNHARKLSINGLFVTKKVQDENPGKIIFVPSYEDLTTVLNHLADYKKETGSNILFKVGFEEENQETIVQFPFKSQSLSPEDVLNKLKIFDVSQNVEDLRQTQ